MTIKMKAGDLELKDQIESVACNGSGAFKATVICKVSTGVHIACDDHHDNPGWVALTDEDREQWTLAKNFKYRAFLRSTYSVSKYEPEPAKPQLKDAKVGDLVIVNGGIVGCVLQIEGDKEPRLYTHIGYGNERPSVLTYTTSDAMHEYQANYDAMCKYIPAPPGSKVGSKIGDNTKDTPPIKVENEKPTFMRECEFGDIVEVWLDATRSVSKNQTNEVVRGVVFAKPTAHSSSYYIGVSGGRGDVFYRDGVIDRVHIYWEHQSEFKQGVGIAGDVKVRVVGKISNLHPSSISKEIEKAINGEAKQTSTNDTVIVGSKIVGSSGWLINEQNEAMLLLKSEMKALRLEMEAQKKVAAEQAIKIKELVDGNASKQSKVEQPRLGALWPCKPQVGDRISMYDNIEGTVIGSTFSENVGEWLLIGWKDEKTAASGANTSYKLYTTETMVCVADIKDYTRFWFVRSTPQRYADMAIKIVKPAPENISTIIISQGKKEASTTLEAQEPIVEVEIADANIAVEEPKEQPAEPEIKPNSLTPWMIGAAAVGALLNAAIDTKLPSVRVADPIEPEPEVYVDVLGINKETVVNGA